MSIFPRAKEYNFLHTCSYEYGKEALSPSPIISCEDSTNLDDLTCPIEEGPFPFIFTQQLPPPLPNIPLPSEAKAPSPATPTEPSNREKAKLMLEEAVKTPPFSCPSLQNKASILTVCLPPLNSLSVTLIAPHLLKLSQLLCSNKGPIISKDTFRKLKVSSEQRNSLTKLSDLQQKLLCKKFPPGSLTTIRHFQRYTFLEFGKILPKEQVIRSWFFNPKNKVIALNFSHEPKAKLIHRICSIYNSKTDLESQTADLNEQERKMVQEGIKQVKVARLCHQAVGKEVTQKEIDYLHHIASRIGGIQFRTAAILLQAVFHINKSEKTIRNLMIKHQVKTPPKPPRLYSSIDIVFEEVERLEET